MGTEVELHVRSALSGGTDDSRLVVGLTAFAGLRVGEIAALSTSDIGKTDYGYTVTVSGRTIPIIDGLAKAVASRPDGYVFQTSTGDPMGPARISRIARRVPPEGVALHSLRRFFVTSMYVASRLWDQEPAGTELASSGKGENDG